MPVQKAHFKGFSWRDISVNYLHFKLFNSSQAYDLDIFLLSPRSYFPIAIEAKRKSENYLENRTRKRRGWGSADRNTQIFGWTNADLKSPAWPGDENTVITAALFCLNLRERALAKSAVAWKIFCDSFFQCSRHYATFIGVAIEGFFNYAFFASQGYCFSKQYWITNFVRPLSMLIFHQSPVNFGLSLSLFLFRIPISLYFAFLSRITFLSP